MKYLLSTLYAQDEQESDSHPDYFLLALTPGTVKYLRDLYEKVKALWELDDSVRSIDIAFGGEYVQYENIEALGLDEIVEQDEINIVELKAADIDAEIPIQEVWKMEAHSAKIFFDGDLIFHAWHKYSGTEFETPLISIDYLEEAIKEDSHD